MTVRYAAEVLGVTPETIRAYYRLGRLTGFQLPTGGGIKIYHESLDRLKEQGGANPRKEGEKE